MRGVALVAAVTVVAEVGDFRRFTNARQLMAYLGLSLLDVREIPVPRPAAIGVASSSFENDNEPNHNEANLDPTATILRFRFSGPLQPQCVYDFDVTTGARSPICVPISMPAS
jgi:hypothetical protein